MNIIKKISLAVSIVMLLGACSTVTIKPEGGAKIIAQPALSESRPFFLWGLVGEQRVDVKEVCGEKTVKQMQSQQTFVDGFLGAITLGIYSPHTVKVWCN